MGEKLTRYEQAAIATTIVAETFRDSEADFKEVLTHVTSRLGFAPCEIAVRAACKASNVRLKRKQRKRSVIHVDVQNKIARLQSEVAAIRNWLEREFQCSLSESSTSFAQASKIDETISTSPSEITVQKIDDLRTHLGIRGRSSRRIRIRERLFAEGYVQRKSNHTFVCHDIEATRRRAAELYAEFSSNTMEGDQ